MSVVVEGLADERMSMVGRRVVGWAGPGAVVAAVLGLMGGCYEERVVSRSLDSLRAIADPKPAWVTEDEAERPGQPQASGSVYSIRVGEYVGVGRHAAAQAALKELEETTGLTGGWMRDSGRAITAFIGRYTDPGGKVAAEALSLVRASGVDQTARANFLALSPGQSIVTDPLDAKAHRGAFSLQVAIYDADFGPGYRKAAESAARTLRNDGEEAFFYHGPHRSMVLIGLFSRDIDFGTRTGALGEKVEVYGPRITNLRKAYPYNLLNGYPRHIVDEEGNPTEDEPMESFVVRIL